MGSGKTTIGKKLASAMNVQFIDLDHYIEEKEKMSVAEIFEKKGESIFRETETHYLEELLERSEPLVVGLGGGTVCFNSNLEKIKKKGTLVYIQLPPKALAERISQSKTERPLVKGLNKEKLLLFVEQKLNERKNFYESAHIIVNGLNLNPQALYQSIVSPLTKNIS